MAREYRTPTAKEREKLEKAREGMQRGIQGEGDIWSKISTTMAKSARDEMKMANKLRESVPEAAREGEAYNQAGYKKGGKVKASSASKRADGIAKKGKTKGRII